LRSIIFIVILILIAQIGIGQSFDVENEKIFSASEIEIKDFASHGDEKGYRAIYYFDKYGFATKSEHYLKRKLLSSHEYHYNEYGLLISDIETFSINRSRSNTTHIRYELNEKDQIIVKAYVFGPGLINTQYYFDHNKLGKPGKIKTIDTDKTESIQLLTYDSLGRIVQFEKYINDSIIETELKEYNFDGDIVYSLKTPFIHKETDSLAIYIECIRLDAEEYYEYTYDEYNRWTEKFVVIDDQRILLETRKYKLKRDERKDEGKADDVVKYP
jgi:hypothetical protein